MLQKIKITKMIILKKIKIDYQLEWKIEALIN